MAKGKFPPAFAKKAKARSAGKLRPAAPPFAGPAGPPMAGPPGRPFSKGGKVK